MKDALSKLIKDIRFILTLFFSSGLAPWALKLDPRPDRLERDDIDFLLDMAQNYEASLEPIQEC